MTGGTLALLLNNDGTKVLEASGRAAVQRGGFRQRERDEGFGGLEHDDDGLQREPADGDVRGISATIHAAPNTESVAVTGLSVSIHQQLRDDHREFRVRGELGRD